MKLQVVLSRLVVGLLLIVIAVPFPAVEAAAIPFEATDEFTPATTLGDGAEIVALEINSPPYPSPEFAEERAASIVTSLDRADVRLPNFPSYSWVFGCSAVSAAMIAAYYDNNGYPNMYTGSTNGGAMPVSDMYAPYTGTYVWGLWNDGFISYPNNPLIASHNGIDGQVVRGSIDDYWVSYLSGVDDPYITNSWTPHTPGTAVGDYMKTSQSAYNNVDGSTHFYTYQLGSDPLTCSAMSSGGVSSLDGTYGRKLFYEERGYTVTDCYNQPTDNYRSGGFSLLDFMAEIDAGHPVLINVTGHSMVGFGYNGSTIYIRDTWNSNPETVYSMPWGGSYQGRELLGVSIVHLTEPSSAPGAFTKSSPSDAATGLTINPTMNWGASSQSYGYQYCYDTTDDNACSNWVDTGFNTSVNLSGLSYNTPYFWQVRSINPLDTTYGNGDPTAFWSFSTMDAPVLSEKMFLPLMVRN